MDAQVDSLRERMPRKVSLCPFRVAQEALTNVMKHSQAKTVIVAGEPDGR